MKKIMMIFACVILCGCTSKYTLEINNDSFKEIIDIVIDKNEIPKKSENQESEIELDDRITPFLKQDTKAIFNNDKKNYKKKVKYYDDIIKVKMSYRYNKSEFLNSNSLNLCFDDAVFTYEDEFYIHAKGTFYCLYTDEVEVNIKTKNKVSKHNADKVNGNVYTWIIDRKNYNNVDIEISMEKGISTSQIINYIIFVVVIVIVGLVIAYKIYIKNKQENSI